MMIIECSAYGPVEEETVSKALADNRIVEVTPIAEEKFRVREMCDEFFTADLTAEQLAQWGRELITLSQKAIATAEIIYTVTGERDYEGEEFIAAYRTKDGAYSRARRELEDTGAGSWDRVNVKEAPLEE